jgi:long-chain acyl-CoA synthetase
VAENRVEWALTDYATLGLGAILVPIYPTLPPADTSYILADSEARAVVVSGAEQFGKLRSVARQTPDVAFVLSMDEVSPDRGSSGDRVPLLSDLWQNEHEPEVASWFRRRALEPQPEDVASILYTSGTTGRPKGVVLTHRNIVSNIRAAEPLFHFRENDISVAFLPLSHIFERMLEFTCFSRGVKIVYPESLEVLPQTLLEVRPTILAAVPRVLEKTYEKVMAKVRQSPASRQRLFHWALQVGCQYFPHVIARTSAPLPVRVQYALADLLVFRKVRAGLGGRVRLVISGAAPLSRAMAEFFYAVGLRVYEGYGLTETAPVIAVNYPGAVRLGTVGKVLPGVELKFGEEFVDMKGHAGREILVRGPNVMRGYHNLEQENREAFADGWFCTGDLGTTDDEGFLTITGRKRNLFKTSGGKFVSPEKLENLFQGHHYVAQIVAVGEARRFVGALVVPNFSNLGRYARENTIAFSGNEDLVRQPAVRSFLQQQVDEVMADLPSYERIHQIALLSRELTVDEGELSATHKVKRAVIEERYRDVIEEIYLRAAPATAAAT